MPPPRQGRTAVGKTNLASNSSGSLRLRCPACRHADPNMVLSDSAQAKFACSSCGFFLEERDGIWRALAPPRRKHFERFIAEYQAIRLKEGRGSTSDQFYLQLPFRDITGANTWQWEIRGRSYRLLERRILSSLERRFPHGLDVLDIGAGNGWLSYRLALGRHRPVAIDLQVNTLDGLGAAQRFYKYLPRSFPLFQAEMENLPFADRQFDLGVYNASFHYAEDYERTMKEACRCLRRPGHLLIVDSPWYQDDDSGKKMLAEQHATFENKYGFRSDSLAYRGFLTPRTLADLASRFGFEWKCFNAWYGLGWALRPWRARVTGKREPSKFIILWATLSA